MNKSELIDAVASSAGLTKTQAGAAVDSVIDAVTKQLKSGGDVRIPGFGNFSVSRRAARTGRNPLTGKPVQIAAKNSPKFSAGKALKDACN